MALKMAAVVLGAMWLQVAGAQTTSAVAVPDTGAGNKGAPHSASAGDQASPSGGGTSSSTTAPSKQGQPGGQTLERVAISQVVSTPPELKVYLDVRGAGDTPVDTLPPESVQAYMDGKALPVNSLKTFASTSEGIAYVFLVDVSKSESKAGFAKVQAALGTFIDQMGPKDQAAIVSFGEEMRDVTAYTGDKAALKQAVSALVNDAKMTHLNGAIVEGLRLSQKTDTNLPLRRAIVVLSDGKDEGSGLTTDDVLHNVADDRVPIYAIGVSDLPKAERAQYLEVLHRYAVLSGGAYYAATEAGVGPAYTEVHDRTARVWVADVNCSGCAADGAKHPLQVRLSVQGQSLGDKIDVTLLPVPPPPPPSKPLPIWKRYSWKVYAGAGAGVAVLIGLAVWLLLRRRKKPVADEEDWPASESIRSEDDQSGHGFLPYTFPAPDSEEVTQTSTAPSFSVESKPDYRPDTRPGVQIELVRKEARQDVPRGYKGKLVDQLVVGRGQGSAIQLPDREISGQHCRIEMVNGHVLVSDMGSTFGTSVNGVPVSARQKVESGDSVALGTVEFRILIQR